MNAFLDKFTVLSDKQYDFVTKCGSRNLWEAFSYELFFAFENDRIAYSLFLDVSKALDTVNHHILLKKFYSMGFLGPFFKIFENVLSNHRQLVSIDNVRNTTVALSAGVPQGFILSPLLFTIYVNDISRCLCAWKLYRYAADTSLLSRHIDYQRAMSILQEDVIKIIDCFSANQVKINPTKTTFVCFCHPLKTIYIDLLLFLHSSLCICCSCFLVPYANTVKYLGISFESNLSRNRNLSNVCQKLRGVS